MKKITKEELLTYTKPTIFEITSCTDTEEEKHYPDSLCLYVSPHCECEGFGAYLIGEFHTEYSYETLYLTRSINWVWVYEEQDLINLRNLIDGVLKGISVIDVECRIINENSLLVRGYYLPLYIKEELKKTSLLIKAINKVLDYKGYKVIGIIKEEIIIGGCYNYYSHPYDTSLLDKILSFEGCEFKKYKGE